MGGRDSGGIETTNDPTDRFWGGRSPEQYSREEGGGGENGGVEGVGVGDLEEVGVYEFEGLDVVGRDGEDGDVGREWLGGEGRRGAGGLVVGEEGEGWL